MFSSNALGCFLYRSVVFRPLRVRVSQVHAVVPALAIGFTLLFSQALHAGSLPVLSVGVLKFGTVNWLLNTITANGFDKQNGLNLNVVPFAGKSATTIAFQGEAVDMFVTDWPWVMRQRADGANYKFSPYSNTVGAIMARSDAGINSVCDLPGKKMGVVGGPLDKSWLLLQAFATKTCGVDLAKDSEAVYGAPPLINEQIKIGAVDAVSTFWHFAARLEASGVKRLIDVTEIMTELGVSPVPPLIGFVWNEDRFSTDRKEIIGKFRQAVISANQLLRSSDEEWDRLRPLMRAKSDAEFAGLKSNFQRGLLDTWTPAHESSSKALHEVLQIIGGNAYTKSSGEFDSSAFYVSN